MANQMAPTAVTLNGLEGHLPTAGFFKSNSLTFVQHFTRFQLTACSRGPSAIAGLLVLTVSSMKYQHALTISKVLLFCANNLNYDISLSYSKKAAVISNLFR